MATIARALLVTTLAILLVLTGAATRAAAAPPGEPGAAIATADAAGETAGEGFPRWAKWTIAGVAILTGLALLLAFVIVPAAVESSVESFEPCCDGGNDGGSGDGRVL